MHGTYCDPSEDRSGDGEGLEVVGELASLYSSTSSNSYHLVSAPPTQYTTTSRRITTRTRRRSRGRRWRWRRCQSAWWSEFFLQLVKFKISGIGREANISVTERFLKSPAISLFWRPRSSSFYFLHFQIDVSVWSMAAHKRWDRSL